MVFSNTGGPVAVAILAALATPVSAFWRLPCHAPLVVQRADPIVNPGKPSGHAHTIMGGNGFGFQMAYADTQAATCSSCMVTQDLSNYWVPKLYYKAKNGSFIDVPQVGGGLIYYLQRDDPKDPEYANGLLAFPEGFRMLAGNPNLRSYTATQSQQAISYSCLGVNGPETNDFPKQNCPAGLRSQVFFPSCWDGVNLDSPDHKSHMSYPSVFNNGICPPSHPKRFISLFYEVVWDVNSFANEWYDGHQPFVWANGDDTGYGYHGDFVNGWHVPTLQQAINECTNLSGHVEDCHVFKFFDDHTTNGCKIPASIDEAVTGLLDALPGCNPVQSGPGMAVPVTGCGAPTTIGTPEYPFTDLTVTKSFEYVGCGVDDLNSRTFQGATFSADYMTIEKCVDFCVSKGFSIAGAEYGRECYCSNIIPADRAPIPNLMGDCFKPCAGDSKEFCGGHRTLSIYRKCGSTCQNAIFGVNNKTSPGDGAPYTPPTYGPPGSVGQSSSAAGYPSPSGAGNWSSPGMRPSTVAPQGTSAAGAGQGSPFLTPAGQDDYPDSGSKSAPVVVIETKTVIPLATIPAAASNADAGMGGTTHTVTVKSTVVVTNCGCPAKTSALMSSKEDTKPSSTAPAPTSSSKAVENPKAPTSAPIVFSLAQSTAAPIMSSNGPYAVSNGTSSRTSSHLHHGTGKHSHIYAHATALRRHH